MVLDKHGTPELPISEKNFVCNGIMDMFFLNLAGWIYIYIFVMDIPDTMPVQNMVGSPIHCQLLMHSIFLYLAEGCSCR